MRKPTFKRKAYTFPLKVDNWFGYVFTATGSMAFQFTGEYKDKGHLHADLVATINGQKKADYTNMDLTYNKGEATIYVNGKEFIIMRGWGHLTGIGGLGYQEHKAAKLQDEFAEFIINKLTT